LAELGLLPFCPHRCASLPGGAPALAKLFQQTSIYQAAVAGHSLPDALRRLASREAEVRLGEHRELRQVLGLVSVPDFTTLYRFLQRLDDQIIDHAVGETVRRLRGSLRQMRK
jgi:hypothetical protein